MTTRPLAPRTRAAFAGGEGTYVIKGVLRTLDGKTEKVSLVLGVR